jgi:hypothetical protein
VTCAFPTLSITAWFILGCAACGPQSPTNAGGADSTGTVTGPGSTSGAPGTEAPTSEAPPDATSAGPAATSGGTDGDSTSATSTDDTGGVGLNGCLFGWERPAAVQASAIRVWPHPLDPEIDLDLDPEFVYPDGTAGTCVRWDGDDLAGIRIAVGPAIGEHPEHVLELLVTDGERNYEVYQWPPPPGAFDGMSAIYTHTNTNDPQVWDFVMNEGLGYIQANWVPRQSGEHIYFDISLSMDTDGEYPRFYFWIDAVIAPAVPLTVEYCAALDAAMKCSIAGCEHWIGTYIVDPTTCESTWTGECALTLDSTGKTDHDSAFFKITDGVAEIKYIGGKGCGIESQEFPIGWSECLGGPDDPPACVCGCAGGTCPGDAGLVLLEGCGLPHPCTDLQNPDGFAWSTHEDCYYDALAAGDPAALRVHVNHGNPDFDDRLYLRGDGTATWLRGTCNVSCLGSCDDRDWGVAQDCMLREPAFFADCAGAVDPWVCRDLSAWVTDCLPAPATCP